MCWFAFHRIEPIAPQKTDFQNENFSKIDTYWDNLHKSIQTIDALNTKLAKCGIDALLGYSYIYDLAADLERYGDHQNELIEHHWNHHILPQLSDIIFSNQITGDDLQKVLKEISISDASLQVNGTTFSENETIDSSRTLDRLQLALVP